ncbi:unnamed protein product [Clonostachys rosea]|uniref:Uncharacterized protein n=1 Tax=Bionectria ochroleuca TaxID=29856 RepID=A0ABY6U8U9_BIOOC|nr:unnamed protein product [Clonostachys rosea]
MGSLRVLEALRELHDPHLVLQDNTAPKCFQNVEGGVRWRPVRGIVDHTPQQTEKYGLARSFGPDPYHLRQR